MLANIHDKRPMIPVDKECDIWTYLGRRPDGTETTLVLEAVYFKVPEGGNESHASRMEMNLPLKLDLAQRRTATSQKTSIQTAKSSNHIKETVLSIFADMNSQTGSFRISISSDDKEHPISHCSISVDGEIQPKYVGTLPKESEGNLKVLSGERVCFFNYATDVDFTSSLENISINRLFLKSATEEGVFEQPIELELPWKTSKCGYGNLFVNDTFVVPTVWGGHFRILVDAFVNSQTGEGTINLELLDGPEGIAGIVGYYPVVTLKNNNRRAASDAERDYLNIWTSGSDQSTTDIIPISHTDGPYEFVKSDADVVIKSLRIENTIGEVFELRHFLNSSGEKADLKVAEWIPNAIQYYALGDSRVRAYIYNNEGQAAEAVDIVLKVNLICGFQDPNKRVITMSAVVLQNGYAVTGYRLGFLKSGHPRDFVKK